LARALLERGVDIYVVPAVPTSPGLVYPANAGFLTRLREEISLPKKTFFISRPLPTRAAESGIIRDFLTRLGLAVSEFPRRFEGEADLFDAGEGYLFTSGKIAVQRFVPRWGWPPYRRVYGFRSDPEALPDIRRLISDRVIPVALARETHYHGDTCLCAFGSRREYLMVYPPALAPESLEVLRNQFKEKLIVLSNEDGECFAANSFQVDGPEPALLMPATASRTLRDQVRARGVVPVPVDVSEFMEKGGGSVKCLVGDLGPWRAGDAGASSDVLAFRRERSYGVLFLANSQISRSPSPGFSGSG
jgi:N-dimethylarginine dimethylaminohydrolase